MTDRLEAYLEQLRNHLCGLPADEVGEILRELRSHVRDSATGPAPTDGELAALLDRLGPAEDLASLYIRDRVLEGARRSRSPLVLASALFRWATVSVAGAFAFLGLLTGYVLSMSFFIAALHDPFAPERVGLWRAGESVSLHLGFGRSAPAGEELLGYWIVPLGLLLGAGGVWLTTATARWCVRALRRPPA